MFRLHGSGTGLLHADRVFHKKAVSLKDQEEAAAVENKVIDPKKKHNGISAPKLLVPIIAVLAFFHALIVFLIISINTTSGMLSQSMQEAGIYTSDISSLIAVTSMMSETSSNYILLPVLENGESNIGPLIAYTGELKSERRGDPVLKRFQDYNVNENVRALVEEAAFSSNMMVENQLHAIALVASVYPIPKIPPLKDLILPELTEEEKTLSDEGKLSRARLLILGEEQGLYKSTTSSDVNNAIALIQGMNAQQSAAASQKLSVLRIVMWIVTLSIILILFFVFLILYRQMVFPLRRFVRLIAADNPLDESKGLEEVRLVAASYNNLLKRRDALDTILRSAAETDSLTNLPNRYSYERQILESDDEISSMAVFLFDVDYLKETNDNYGHAAGDELLRQAAECISSCFGETEKSTCFRFGGDEFAAVIRECDPIQIGRMIEKFEILQAKCGISISWGYDYVDSLQKTTVKNLFDQADRNMYEHKKKVHEAHSYHHAEDGGNQGTKEES